MRRKQIRMKLVRSSSSSTPKGEGYENFLDQFLCKKKDGTLHFSRLAKPLTMKVMISEQTNLLSLVVSGGSEVLVLNDGGLSTASLDSQEDA